MKYSTKRSKPDLMTVLILVVALGVVITLSAQAKIYGKESTLELGSSSPALISMQANAQR